MVNFLIILIISVIATQLTHELSLKNNIGAVRASSGLTLLFIGLTFTISHPIISSLHAVFLGSSFVGMTEPKRLTRSQLAVASLTFCLIFNYLLFHLKGFAGTLGLSAFVSCLITYFLEKQLAFLKKRP